MLSALAFPLQCISCGNQAYGLALCKNCQRDIIYNYSPREKRCKTCGVLLISEIETCLDCREIEESEKRNSAHLKSEILKDFSSVFPIHQYTLWKKELLFAWKMANNRSITPVLAKTIEGVLQKYYANIIVVPVPPREGKIKKRGWDQIDELCMYLQAYYNIPVQKLLIRTSKDEQKKRNRKERLENIEKNFKFIKGKSAVPREVVLIDDIMTTGATLESCARALKDGGVDKVHGVTIFYV